ncbi:MAG TPA: heavy-metal-associated domain-containing protein [Bacillota bacterium]|nr:heavy-metal-associated domain-containing protein [Bacillota bacterium]
MKRAIVEGMCCTGCAEEVKHIFENIYGVSNVKVSIDTESVTYEGFVSKRVIDDALQGTGYTLKGIEKISK